jgi:mannitol/fructose-specific phosphotransferase system IIA component (Ntr-type)
VINDRLHNLSLAILPQIARHFKSRVQIAFEVPMRGIFAFAMEPDGEASSKERMLEQIVQLPIEVGTRITILSWGLNRFKANDAIKNVLQNLWQCDDWLRKRSAPIESDGTILELLEFAERIGQSQSPEYGFIQNPYISNLLTSQHVFINPDTSAFSKEDVLSQLAAAHARIHKLEIASVLDRVKDAEKREPIILREGFSIAHGAMERTPRISITFGVYSKGVSWDSNSRIVRLVSMVVFAKDTYGTWRDYLRKMAIVFRAYPNLQEQLIRSQNSDEFRAKLRQTETAMIK